LMVDHYAATRSIQLRSGAPEGQLALSAPRRGKSMDDQGRAVGGLAFRP
jgi:hypothetical protein